jgi:hypothetical protein
MITIFCDFPQFSAKKLAFFLNTNVMINFFQNLALFLVKNANFFPEIFGKNISKIITSVPGRAFDVPRRDVAFDRKSRRSRKFSNPSLSSIVLIGLNTCWKGLSERDTNT